MADNTIIDILKRQKREFEEKIGEKYIPRQLQIPDPENHLIKVIIGPRRSGKSFLGMQLMHSLGSGAYVNFDDERLTGLPDYDALFDAVDTLYDKPVHLLLDEIQNVEKWELLVSRLQRQGRRLLVTGSNAHLLSSEFATHLTGRHVPLVLFPLSFREYQSAGDGRPATDSETRESLSRYLRHGGFPEPLQRAMDYNSYLRPLIDSILFKDVIKRRRLRSPRGLEDLARYLLSNTGSEYSLRTLAEVTKVTSYHTVEKYLAGLEEAFLLFSLRRYSPKVREQAKANKKIYSIDNGLIAAGGFQLSENTGRLAENAVAISLFLRQLEGKGEVFFWKNAQNEEVDFVIRRDRRVAQLVQVCWDPGAPGTREREIRALVKAGRDLQCTNLLILTGEMEGVEEVSWFGITGTVHFLPLWKWMLEAEN